MLQNVAKIPRARGAGQMDFVAFKAQKDNSACAWCKGAIGQKIVRQVNIVYFKILKTEK